MSYTDDCPAGRSQFLTRGSLFKVHAAKIYVLDCITHGTALEILSRASAACRFKSPYTAVSDHQWREYFGLPVMSLSAAAKYYGLKVSEIEHHTRKKNTYAGGLFESGMLVLRGAALEFARFMGHTAEIQQGCVLLPPRAVLSLCLSLRPVPAVAATVNAFWDYVLTQKLPNLPLLIGTIFSANTLKLSAKGLKNKGCSNVWHSQKSANCILTFSISVIKLVSRRGRACLLMKVNSPRPAAVFM